MTEKRLKREVRTTPESLSEERPRKSHLGLKQDELSQPAEL